MPVADTGLSGADIKRQAVERAPGSAGSQGGVDDEHPAVQMRLGGPRDLMPDDGGKQTAGRRHVAFTAAAEARGGAVSVVEVGGDNLLLPLPVVGPFGRHFAAALAAQEVTTLRIVARDALWNPQSEGGEMDTIVAWAETVADNGSVAISLLPQDFTAVYEGSGVWAINFTLQNPGSYFLRVAINPPAGSKVGSANVNSTFWAAAAEAAGVLFSGGPVPLLCVGVLPVVSVPSHLPYGAPRWGITAATNASACGAATIVQTTSESTTPALTATALLPFTIHFSLLSVNGEGVSVGVSDPAPTQCSKGWLAPPPPNPTTTLTPRPLPTPPLPTIFHCARP